MFRWQNILFALPLLSVCLSAQTPPERVPDSLRVPERLREAAIRRPRAQRGLGLVSVVVGLADKPLAGVVGPNAKKLGFLLNAQQQRAYVGQLQQKQTQVAAQVQALGGTTLTRLTKAHNALVVRIESSRLQQLAGIAGVTSVRVVRNYKLDLSDTVPYVGATAVQAAGVDGTGVTVAVLDSGIDYTHRNLGGPGTVAAYQLAAGATVADPKHTTRDGLFPTAKVIGGYDFVGEVWPNEALPDPDVDLALDPDPIDREGHGTHVADIIAGRSADGRHKGVAPGASLYAVKVCSAVASSCSGIALLQGMDFALDPNGDNSISDAADVINMSLGSDYGQREDDLSYASAIATQFGVVVVASAGNGGNKPYIAGSPSTAPEVISVAQSEVPFVEANFLRINTPASIARTIESTVKLEWTPPVLSPITGVVYALSGVNQACSRLTGTDATQASGKILLIVRGGCNISDKVNNAYAAGALAAIISYNVPGPPPGFSQGSLMPFVPTIVISLRDGDLIRSQPNGTVNATILATQRVSRAGNVVSSSSRGPDQSYQALKPDIAAPGASISAVAGTGTGEAAFGGTSGAAPMVSGAAALLLQRYPFRVPAEIKAALMGTAETDIYTDNWFYPGVLAPLSRVGGGELRVDRAIAASTLLYDGGAIPAVSTSLGFQALTARREMRRKYIVQNLSNTSRTYTIASNFRYANDAASGALTIAAPPSITVGPQTSATFNALFTIVPANLPAFWPFANPGLQGDASYLDGPEIDGFLTVTSGSETVHVPWHVLPRRASNPSVSATTVSVGSGTAAVTVSNVGGVTDSLVSVFALTDVDPPFPAAFQPGRGEGYSLPDLRAVGIRPAITGTTPLLQFAATYHTPTTTALYPDALEVQVDTNGNNRLDGGDSFIYVIENGGFGASGLPVVWVYNGTTGISTPTGYLAQADFNSRSLVMTVPLSALGFSSFSRPVLFQSCTYDNYFTIEYIDCSREMTVTPGNLRYYPSAYGLLLAPNASANLGVIANPAGNTASPSQTGLLLLYGAAKPGQESQEILVQP